MPEKSADNKFSVKTRFMKHRCLLIVAAVVSQSCSEKKAQIQNDAPILKPSVEKNQKSETSSLDVRQAAITNLGSLIIKTPEDLKNYRSQLESFSEKLANSEHLPLGDARNELFLALTEHQPKAIQTGIKGAFFQVVLNDPRGIAAAMGELPAGDLRRSNVAFIRGTEISLDDYEKIYHAMPESRDRSVIAKSLVQGWCFERGVNSTVDLVRSLKAVDRGDALEELSDQIVEQNNDSGKKTVTQEDVEKVRAFAISIGQEHAVKSLSQIVWKNNIK